MVNVNVWCLATKKPRCFQSIGCFGLSFFLALPLTFGVEVADAVVLPLQSDVSFDYSISQLQADELPKITYKWITEPIHAQNIGPMKGFSLRTTCIIILVFYSTLQCHYIHAQASRTLQYTAVFLLNPIRLATLLVKLRQITNENNHFGFQCAELR